jgi:hypothetical protein
MKHLILICLLSSGAAIAQHSNMQLNFGARNTMVNTSGGYAGNPVSRKGEYGNLGNSEAGMLSNFRGHLNVMVMMNNHNILACDQMSRPRFINSGIAYDDLLSRETFTLGYGQSTRLYLPGSYTEIKGYWSANLAVLDEQKMVSKGLNLAFSGYTKKFGIELSATYAGKFISTAIVHRKLVRNFMVAAGVENNCPKAGLEYMARFMRISLYSTRIGERVIPGFSTTFNL